MSAKIQWKLWRGWYQQALYVFKGKLIASLAVWNRMCGFDRMLGRVSLLRAKGFLEKGIRSLTTGESVSLTKKIENEIQRVTMQSTATPILKCDLSRMLATPLRRCQVTRYTYPMGVMVRFVRGEDSNRKRWVIPDVHQVLSGYGTWVLCNRQIMKYALEQNPFRSSYRDETINIPQNMLQDLEAKLFNEVIESLFKLDSRGLVIWGENNILEYTKECEQNMRLPRDSRSDTYLPPSVIVSPIEFQDSETIKRFCNEFGTFLPKTGLVTDADTQNASLPPESLDLTKRATSEPFAIKTTGFPRALRAIYRLCGIRDFLN